jgi:hypothetical protein
MFDFMCKMAGAVTMFRQCAVNTIPIIWLDLDKGGMVYLRVRSTAESTVLK